MGVNWLKKILTFQPNKWWGSAKAGQVMSIEHTFHLGVKVSPWVTTFILQLHLDVVLELIKFCEYRYYRDLKNHVSVQLIKLQFRLDMPFLSGQISAKCFKSSEGRSLSIGMQYLRRNVLYL